MNGWLKIFPAYKNLHAETSEAFFYNTMAGESENPP